MKRYEITLRFIMRKYGVEYKKLFEEIILLRDWNFQSADVIAASFFENSPLLNEDIVKNGIIIDTVVDIASHMVEVDSELKYNFWQMFSDELLSLYDQKNWTDDLFICFTDIQFYHMDGLQVSDKTE